ncbi:MAG TPA: DUF92 domain-containing protein [Thermoanaerobaculia bacterium]|nr:DUF92 domain-containing protein [Thermoanaerobaculia bacterium]
MRSETARKLVHMGFGLCALTLRWLTPWQAAGVAVGAILFNWLVLPHVGGKRIARTERGWDRGILLYPIAVLAVIVAFPQRPDLAALVWAILAFGDGSATLAGIHIRGPRLPWNQDKSVAGTAAFLLAGSAAGWCVVRFVGAGEQFLPGVLVVILAVAAAAIVESLPLNVDDNITVPLTAGLVVAALSSARMFPQIDAEGPAILWLAINAVLAFAGYALRSVNVSGMVGGFLLGAVMILFAGWELYVVLLAFFVIGTAATKLGYRRKEALGLAQEGKGRRGFTHAFSNVGVAAIFALLIGSSSGSPVMLWLAAIASLATAAADTTGSEIGQLVGRQAFLPLTLRRVPVGTEGAISIEGTLAGLVAGVLVSLIGCLLLIRHAAPQPLGEIVRAPWLWNAVLITTLAAFLGSWLESIAGSWNRRQQFRVPNGALNFFNTLAGAMIAMFLTRWLW